MGRNTTDNVFNRNVACLLDQFKIFSQQYITGGIHMDESSGSHTVHFSLQLASTLKRCRLVLNV